MLLPAAQKLFITMPFQHRQALPNHARLSLDDKFEMSAAHFPIGFGMVHSIFECSSRKRVPAKTWNIRIYRFN